LKLQHPSSKLQVNIKLQTSNLPCAPSIGAWSFWQRSSWIVALLLFVSSVAARGATPDASFRDGASAYHAGDYPKAAEAFRQSATRSPGSGTLQNLGLAEWQRGRIGDAIVAWEQSLWLAPWNESARTDLRFARKAAQLESPELSWNEVISTWLPVNWWAWIAGVSLWIAVGVGILPGVLRRPKAAWHQA
jgi:tetratricopeptide (TPR) repeat protein